MKGKLKRMRLPWDDAVAVGVTFPCALPSFFSLRCSTHSLFSNTNKNPIIHFFYHFAHHYFPNPQIIEKNNYLTLIYKISTFQKYAILRIKILYQDFDQRLNQVCLLIGCVEEEMKALEKNETWQLSKFP